MRNILRRSAQTSGFPTFLVDIYVKYTKSHRLLSVPLAFDRASESKVGVFYTKLGERTGNNDHVVVRILNKNKQNLTMYSVKLFRVGTVSIHINKLEARRNGGEFIQQDGRKVSVNNVISLDRDRYQGFQLW